MFAVPIFAMGVLQSQFGISISGSIWGSLIACSMVIMFILPPASLLISLFAPTTRYVNCLKCGWNYDYPNHKPSLKKRGQQSI
jgi:hypothetical protein